jgi:glycosyltransferase involved in cell wall biosynthesis
MNESLITRARNTCADEFLNSTDATHLLFIDADIGFNPEDIPKMIDRDVDIVCGLYPKKEINWPRISNAVLNGVAPQQLAEHAGSVVVNLVKSEATFVNSGDLLEINNGGTGFMLIKREVFQKLSKKVPQYLSDMYTATDIVTEPKYIKEFFTTSIDKETGRLMSEDYHFCILARKHGFKVYADPMIDLTHTGTYIFSGATERIVEGQKVPKQVTKHKPAKKTNVKPRKTAQAKSR